MPPRFAFLRSLAPSSLASAVPIKQASTAGHAARVIHTASSRVRAPSPSLSFSRHLPPSRSLSIPSKNFAAKHPYLTIGFRLTLSAGVGLGLIIGVILAHDAFTYSDKHVDRVPINPLSLHPRRGGKKNLPILEVNLDAEEAEKMGMKNKPRLVIVGGGWGVSLDSFSVL